jgi:hypothetical protein
MRKGKFILKRKIFISHASKDKKSYVDILYKKLKTSLIGEDNIIYDSESFGAGEVIADEINNYLEQTALFILLISDNSLESDWVKKEIKFAHDKLSDNPMQILPLIIDDNITHSDKRIPDWLREYSLQVIKKPTKAEAIIVQRYGEVVWYNNPTIKLRETVFVGRNEEIETFEERYSSYELQPIAFFITSGLDGIGRKSFTKAALKKIDKIKPTYQFPKVVLDRYQSIEDFISELIDFEYIDEKYKVNLGRITIDEKVNILLESVENIRNQKQVIQILDSGAIVTPQGNLVDWFKLFVEKTAIEYQGLGITFSIISKYKLNTFNIRSLQNIYSVNIDELSINDRKKLLAKWREIEEIDLSTSQLEMIRSHLTGFPDEVFQIMRLIKNQGIHYLENHLDFISAITEDSIGLVMKEFYDDNLAMDILALIAKFDFIGFSTLSRLLKKDEEKIQYIEKFILLGICSYIGKAHEYLIMNTGFRIYINRLQRPIRYEFDVELRAFAEENIKSIDEIDWGTRQYVMQNSLLNGNVPDEYLIPSIYLKTIKQLYDNRQPEDLLIRLADKILESRSYLDLNILNEVRFFLCSALARKKDSTRFHEEVRNFDGYKREFLFGFYYRHIGKYDKAIESFKKTLSLERNFNQAKRELVLSYTKMERYNEAADLALENYTNNRSNPYHIHAYYKVLMHQTLSHDVRLKKLDILLSDMEKIQSIKANNMYWTMKGEIALNLKNDYDEALRASIELNNLDEDNIYTLIYNREFYFKYSQVDGLDNVLNKLKRYNNINNTYYLDFIKAKVYFHLLNNQYELVDDILSNDLNSEKDREIIMNRIKDLHPELVP